jgi:hypothetical protein
VISYLYWALVIAVAIFVFWGLGRFWRLKAGLVGAILILLIGWGMYFFHYEQVFVKNYGGIMQISTSDGLVHLATTWKEDNLWVENYDPKTNTCIFSEYSKGSLLEGKVYIKNCNPYLKTDKSINNSEGANSASSSDTMNKE